MAKSNLDLRYEFYTPKSNLDFKTRILDGKVKPWLWDTNFTRRGQALIFEYKFYTAKSSLDFEYEFYTTKSCLDFKYEFYMAKSGHDFKYEFLHRKIKPRLWIRI
jgi:hypothetical protein